jgi:large subunit ribosomal protein L6
MSKIGRKKIDIAGVNVSVTQGNIVSYKGKELSGEYVLPQEFEAKIEEDKFLFVLPKKIEKPNKKINMMWGLHRALLQNLILGAQKLFEKKIIIEGLGYKAELKDNLVIFSLGFSHKIDYSIPSGVSIEVDKTKQNILLRSPKKDLLGDVAATIRAFRPVEPYKGKGIRYADETVLRKEGKKK